MLPAACGRGCECFEDCRIRVVLRATEVYAEIGRMLWHPVSLHNPEPARQRAFGLLEKMAANLSVAPSDPAVINAEIDELLEGDIPYFVAVAREGRLHGPRGTYWLPPSIWLKLPWRIGAVQISLSSEISSRRRW